MDRTQRIPAARCAVAVGIGLATLGTAVAPAQAAKQRERDKRRGQVYASTNASGGNQIVVFNRKRNGRLRPTRRYDTGGTGSGAPAGSGFEQSQNGLILGGQPGADRTPFKNFLFAVNAGSNSISVFRASKDGARLRSTGEPVDSGGTKPTSLTVHGNVLYVLNAGAAPLGQGGVAPSISGFRIQPGGTLTPIPDSTKALSGGPTAGAAQVEFTPNGKTVTVTERNASILESFVVNGDGTLGEPVITQSDGEAPFGFAASRRNPGRLFVAQGNFPPPSSGAASSYDISSQTAGGRTISGDVSNRQSDSCWVVLSHNEHFAYVTNFFSNTISSYRIGRDGTMTLVNARAAVTDKDTSFGANDEATSRGRRFLYARNFVDGSITAFRIHRSGRISKIGQFGDVGPGTGFGLAAR